MRARRRLLGPLSALVGLTVVVSAALAATVGQLETLAESKGLFCNVSGGQVVCADYGEKGFSWQAVIQPTSGQETLLATTATFFGAMPAGGMDAAARDFFADMHALACGAPATVADFVDTIGDLQSPQTGFQATIGNCQFGGRMDNIGQLAPNYRWSVFSAWVPPPTPSPTPVVTPSPTPKITPKPTPKITAAPTPTVKPAATATPKPSPTPQVTPTTGPAPTATTPPSASPSAAPSASASAEPSPSPAASAAPTAAPIVATPSPPPPTPTAAPPTAAPTEPPPAGPAEPAPPPWEESVLGIEEVNADGGAIGGSLLLALLLLLLIGFIGELFNNTVETNYTEIAGWFRKGPLGRARQALGRLPRVDPPGRPGVLVFIALTALISSFVDTGFGLNGRSIAIFLGFLVGLIVVLASFKLPPLLARRRRTGELGQLRPLPWALVIAALFVLVSRLANLQPGYLYGIVLGAIFVTDVSDRDEGRETFWGSIWTLVAAVLAWIGLTWLRGLGVPADGFGYTLLSTAFAATMVAGLEAAAFALMPMRFLPGYQLYKWNRPVWALLWAASLFAFFHILIGPTSGYVSELTPQAFMAALGVFAAFGALSIGTWLYFRFRTPSLPAQDPGPAEAG